ncbi:hypothetical protein [Salinimonas sediminis]|uniref:hypothetical protein n=1 Tax=Salinimonas sediminis TaxID=2303538 RepID=UPI001475E530|nr:hypothetical protein [Salinimonas sediminis]
MDISGANSSATSGASLELAKSQQKQEGQATLQLLESAADVPKATSANPAVGANINTYA